MCGRFSLALPAQEIREELPFVEINLNIRPNYNIAPTQHAYVVANREPYHLDYITWGLIPFWANSGRNTGSLINARAEGIEAKPSFRIPIRQRRCLVLADGFYEWRKTGLKRTPFRAVAREGKLLTFAGIWDEWNKEGYPVHSFSIITVQANSDLESIHERMPLILTGEQRRQWLDDIPLSEVLGMLHPPPPGLLRVYKVSDAVNSVQNNGPELYEEEPEQLDLFSQR